MIEMNLFSKKCVEFLVRIGSYTAQFYMMKVISAYSEQFTSENVNLSILFDGIVADMQRLGSSLDKLKKVRVNEHVAIVKGIRTFLVDLNQHTTNMVISMTVRFLSLNGKNFDSYPVSDKYVVQFEIFYA